MDNTRVSLIEQLSTGHPEAWQEVNAIYRPLIENWLRRYRLQPSDVEDLTQEVMSVLIRQIPTFDHNGRVGAFRNWLRTTTANLAGNYIRRKNIPVATGSSDFQLMLNELQDSASDTSQAFNREHDRCVIRRLLMRIENEFEPKTMQIFQRHVVDGASAAETAEHYEVTTATVHTAKSRVLRKLRQYASDVIDDSELI